MTKEGKHSFLFEYEFLDFFEYLEDFETVQLIKDIVIYDRDGIIPNYTDRTLKTIFNKIKKVLDERKVAYARTCETNKANGRKGGRPKKSKKSECNPQKPNGLNLNPKNLDIDYDYDLYVCNNIEENSKEEITEKKYCHLGSEFKNEYCRDCLKNNQCPNPTDPNFIVKHNCKFEEWINKTKDLSIQIINSKHDPPTKEGQDLSNYNWFEDSEQIQ